MALIAAVAVSATVFIFLMALGGSEVSMRSRLEALTRPSQEEGQKRRVSLSGRLLAPGVETLVGQVRRLMPNAMLDGVHRRLILAGEPMTLNGFLTLQLLVTGTFVLLPVLIIFAMQLSFSPVLLLVVGGFAVAGFWLPHLWLQQRVGLRRNQIIKSLPDAFDLITTCVEAGLGLDAALARVAEKVEGPFALELHRALREIALGKMRRDALRELADRTGAPDLVTFVNAVIQAEQMGSSIGTVLRVQAEQLRVRRRQRAEEQAQKAPVKMIFPLVLCIFPTLFIVILGPAIITIMQEFPGTG